MGLSDEERMNGVYYAVKAINETLKTWEESIHDSYHKDKYPKIKELIGRMWHALFGQTSNGLHWIIGSSSDNSLNGHSNSPWEVGVTQNLSPVMDKIKRANDGPEYYRFEPEDKQVFNALEFCGIKNLASYDDNAPCRYVFEIYQWLESLSYYLRRYKDEFLDKYSKLDELVSALYGECYVAFKNEPAFAKAYVLHQIMEALYGPGYPWNDDPDPVVKVLKEHHLHHDFPKRMKHWGGMSIDDLAKLHIELVKTTVIAKTNAKESHKWAEDTNLLKLRATTLLQLIDSPYEYAHIRKSMISILEQSPVLKELGLSTLFDEQDKRYREQKEKESKRQDDSHLDALNCYGYYGYGILYEALKPTEKINLADVGRKPRKPKISKKKLKKQARKLAKTGKE